LLNRKQDKEATMRRTRLPFALLGAGLLLAAWIPAAGAQDGAFEGDTYPEDGGYQDEWLDEQYASDPEPSAAAAEPEVDTSYFYDKLAPYGEWLWTPEHGWVWQPSGMPAGWRPYTHGQWVYTDQGWTWASSFAWGWAPFHYGRWAYLNPIGWVWVPGRVWGPAWVVWRYSGVYAGWAPLLAGYDYWYGWSYYPVHYSHWTFISWHHFCCSEVHHHAVSRARTKALFRHSYYPRRCRDSAGPACRRGPARAAVQRVAQRRIHKSQIENVAPRSPRQLKSADPRRAELGLADDRLRVFRPRMPVERPAAAQPRRSARDLGSAAPARARPAKRPRSVDLGVIPNRTSMQPAEPAAPIERAGRMPGERAHPSRQPTPGATIQPDRPSRSRLDRPGGRFEMRPSQVQPGQLDRPASKQRRLQPDSTPSRLQRSPRLRPSQPRVRHTSPKVRHNRPKVRHSTPKLRRSSPEVRRSSPEVRRSSPEVRRSSPKVRRSSPKRSRSFNRSSSSRSRSSSKSRSNRSRRRSR
jgi:hypothetical protein